MDCWQVCYQQTSKSNGVAKKPVVGCAELNHVLDDGVGEAVIEQNTLRAVHHELLNKHDKFALYIGDREQI